MDECIIRALDGHLTSMSGLNTDHLKVVLIRLFPMDKTYIETSPRDILEKTYKEKVSNLNFLRAYARYSRMENRNVEQ